MFHTFMFYAPRADSHTRFLCSTCFPHPKAMAEIDPILALVTAGTLMTSDIKNAATTSLACIAHTPKTVDVGGLVTVGVQMNSPSI